uniref:Cysteine rich secreted protein n=1 Tax=Riptortus pedestris TaxID=329032 RepID=R4WRY5_RIPPE|nr:cysteine rich secreted protein [Riptortus pedestris]
MAKLLVIIFLASVVCLVRGGIDKRGWEMCTWNTWCVKGYYCCNTYYTNVCCPRSTPQHQLTTRDIRKRIFLPQLFEWPEMRQT